MEPEPQSPVLIFQSRAAGIGRKPLRDYAARLSAEVARGGIFTCLFTGDRRLRELNRRFLGKDYATDVLSFPQASFPSLGEIAVSVARARQQARDYGHSLEDELKILMLHGVLHLMGHDHESDSGSMRRLETRWRKRFGLPHGLIERGSA
jgi:probable rRNA maturation factor